MSSAVLHPSSSTCPAARSLPSASSAHAVAPRIDASELAYGRAASLRVERAGVLRVSRGRLWVTRDATRRRATEDLVLAPGDVLPLAVGDRIVMEPWDARGAVYAWSAGPNSVNR
jgi:hypothetical protein